MIWEFLLASLFIELTPGPNMGWLALLSARRGRAVGLSAVAGISMGLAIAGGAAALGVSLLIAATPWMFQALRLAGAAYLLYLAWDSWKDGSAESDANGFEQPKAQYLKQGLIGNMLNPKAYLVYAAVLPQFLTGSESSLSEILLLTALYVAVATLVHAAIALLAGSAASFLQHPKRRMMLARVSAALLVAMAGWFFFATRPPA